MTATLILLHGIGGNAAGFAPVVTALAGHGLAAQAFSQPGYDGTPLVTPYDLDQCATALGAWLDRLQPGAIVLVGHSMGGMLAQSLWRQAGNPTGSAGSSHDAAATAGRGWSIQGLVLAHTSPAFGNPDGDFQRRFVASRTKPLDEGQTMHEVASRIAPTMVAPGTSAAAIARAVAMMAAVPPATYRLAVQALTGFDGRPALPGITVPTLCLAAEHDQTAPPAVLSRMAARIPAADYQCLAGLGHLAPIEDPERWSDAIATWCRRRLA